MFGRFLARKTLYIFCLKRLSTQDFRFQLTKRAEASAFFVSTEASWAEPSAHEGEGWVGKIWGLNMIELMSKKYVSTSKWFLETARKLKIQTLLPEGIELHLRNEGHRLQDDSILELAIFQAGKVNT